MNSVQKNTPWLNKVPEVTVIFWLIKMGFVE